MEQSEEIWVFFLCYTILASRQNSSFCFLHIIWYVLKENQREKMNDCNQRYESLSTCMQHFTSCTCKCSGGKRLYFFNFLYLWTQMKEQKSPEQRCEQTRGRVRLQVGLSLLFVPGVDSFNLITLLTALRQACKTLPDNRRRPTESRTTTDDRNEGGFFHTGFTL